MRFVHSFGTRPMGINMGDENGLKRILGNICYYALSVSYLKMFGQKIVLHTDSLGESLMSHIPYDEIILTSDEIPENISPRFWAFSKMWALEQEPLDSIHIDGDVFIKKESLINDLLESNYDLLAQSFEDTVKYQKLAHICWKDPIYCESKGLNVDEYGAYNTGIMGFGNQELKDKFLSGYKDLVLHYSDKFGDELLQLSSHCPDIIFEQKYIYQLSKNYNVKLLLDSSKLPTEFRTQSNEIGYQHVFSNVKFNQIDKCLYVLKNIDFDLYKKTSKICWLISKDFQNGKSI